MSVANFIKYNCATVLFCSVLLAIALSANALLPNKMAANHDPAANWYLYGLRSQKDVDLLQQTLAPYKIKLISRGCILGGNAFEKEMKSNQRVYESASDELKLLLEKPRT
jgi:hypothetical protein